MKPYTLVEVYPNTLGRDAERMAGQILERAVVKSDSFRGNKCFDQKCLPSQNPKNTITCIKKNVGYKISCKHCKAAYLGETGENMHTQFKSHLSKYNSRVKATRESSAFVEHICNTHEGIQEGKKIEDYFEVFIFKS